jgi:competence protein ComK
MNKYNITDNTLAILPMGNKNSVVYEVDKMIVINNKPNNIIKYNCEIDGSSYDIRVNYYRNMTGNMYKTPILVKSKNNIVFFPTCSPRVNNVSWLNLKSINNIYSNDKNNCSVIELTNGNKIDFKESIWSLKNQILKASRFEFLLRKKEA